MKLSRTVAYALQALLQLASAPDGKPMSCAVLARQGHMPERFLLQILRSLVRSDVLKSLRGVEGGYILQRPLEKISLLELCETFDAGIVPSVPPLAGLTDETRHQLLKVMARTAAAMRAELSAVRLSELVAAPSALGQIASANSAQVVGLEGESAPLGLA